MRLIALLGTLAALLVFAATSRGQCPDCFKNCNNCDKNCNQADFPDAPKSKALKTTLRGPVQDSAGNRYRLDMSVTSEVSGKPGAYTLTYTIRLGKRLEGRQTEWVSANSPELAKAVEDGAKPGLDNSIVIVLKVRAYKVVKDLLTVSIAGEKIAATVAPAYVPDDVDAKPPCPCKPKCTCNPCKCGVVGVPATAVFADSGERAPAIVGSALVALLGHESYKVRELATAALGKAPAAMLWPALHNTQGSPETMQRCRILAAKAWLRLPLEFRQAEAAKLRPAGQSHLPRIAADCIYECCPCRYLSQESSTAERVRDLVSAGATLRAVQEALDWLATAEKLFLEEDCP